MFVNKLLFKKIIKEMCIIIMTIKMYSTSAKNMTRTTQYINKTLIFLRTDYRKKHELFQIVGIHLHINSTLYMLN